MQRRLLPLIVWSFLALGLVPLTLLIVSSFTVNGSFDLARYVELFTSPRLPPLMGHSVLLAALTTLGALAVGVPLGLLFGRTDLPGRHLFTAGFTVPLLLPPYFLALGWFALLGREGALRRILPDSLAGTLSAWLFGLPGCALTLGTVFLPLVMLLTMSLARGVNPRWEEAARMCASWPSVWCRITLAVMLPGMVFGALLVFLLALGELSVPMFLRYDVYPLEIFTQFAAAYDFGAATAAATPLILIVGLLLLADKYGREMFVADARPAGTHAPVRLGEATPWWLVAVASLLLVLVGLPLGALAIRVSLADFTQAWRLASDALGRSVLYAALSASLLTAVGVLLGMLWRERSRGAVLTEFVALLLLILPSSVIGIALIGLWNRPILSWLYASPALLLMGYLIQYAALSGGTIRGALLRLPAALEQAAAIAGAGWWRRLMAIVLPQIAPGIVATWLICYLFCLRDSGLAMLAYPPGADTLPVRVFTLMANSPFSLVAALCSLLIASAAPPVAAIAWLSHRGGRLR